MGQPLSLHHWQRLFIPDDGMDSNFILLENYQNIPTGVINYSLYANLSGSSNWASVDADGDNRYLRFYPDNNDTHQFFDLGSQIIPTDQPFTLYFRFYINKVASRVNTQLRVHSSSYFRMKFDTDFANPFILWYDNPTHTGGAPDVVLDQQIEENVWYECWAHFKAESFSHIDTATASRYEAYIRGGAFNEITRLTTENDDPYKYLYNNSGDISSIFLIGWTGTDHILHNDFHISFGDEADLTTPVNRLWFDRMQGYTDWDTVSTAWKAYGKNVFEDGDHVGFIMGPVTITEDVKPASIVVGFDTTIIGNYSLSGDYLKVLNGFCTLDGWNVSLDFEYLYIGNGGALIYRDSFTNFFNNLDTYKIGKGIITLDSGILRIQRGESNNAILLNDILVTAQGGTINSARRAGNPINSFSGTVTLEGNLTLRSGGGGNNERTQDYTGNTILKANVAIRGIGEFGNGKFPVFSGPIIEEGGSRQLTLSYEQISGTGLTIESVCTYTGGTIIDATVASSGIIRIRGTGRLGLGYVEIRENARISFQTSTAMDSSSNLIILSTAGEVEITAALSIAGLIFGGTPLTTGTYTVAQLETFFGNPAVFTGTGSITVP